MKSKFESFLGKFLEWRRKTNRQSISRQELFDLMIEHEIFSRNTQLMYEKMLKAKGALRDSLAGYELNIIQLLELEEQPTVIENVKKEESNKQIEKLERIMETAINQAHGNYKISHLEMDNAIYLITGATGDGTKRKFKMLLDNFGYAISDAQYIKLTEKSMKLFAHLLKGNASQTQEMVILEKELNQIDNLNAGLIGK